MLTKAKEGVEKTLKHLEHEYSKLLLGRANPVMVEGVMVDQYGSLQKIQNIASVSNMDSQTLVIKPWDRSVIHSIAKAISESGLGLNPQTMADSIIIKVPPLTEERRKEVSKMAKKMSEEAKVGIRNARSESLKAIKNAEDTKQISEDQRKDIESELQKLIDDANKKVEDHYKQKDTDIMKM